MAAPQHFAHGIDMSRWDPSYNPYVKPVDFAILKASEGSTWLDPKFDDHLAACRAAGMLAGAYHYYRSGIPWRAQLDNFLRATKGKTGLSKLMALDYEYINNTLTAATDKELREFYMALVLLGFKPVIYTSYGEYNNMIKRGAKWIADPETGLWVARWFSREYYYTRATGPGAAIVQWDRGRCIWQYGGDYKHPTEKWEVPGYKEAAAYGVSGKDSIDLNVYNGTIQDMRTWFEAPAPEPIPFPPQPGAEPEPPAEAEGYIQCQHCGVWMDEWQPLCPQCGAPVPPPLVEAEKPRMELPQSYWRDLYNRFRLRQRH